MRHFISAIALLTIFAPARIAFAHGVVGDYMFLEPLIAEDPTPANEFDIVQPQWTKTSEGRTFSLGTSIEKILAIDSNELPRLSVGVGDSWICQSPKNGPNVNGFNDLDLFIKYAFLVVPQHEFLMGAMLDLQAPLGDPHVQTQNHTSLGPELVWEKGLGDLPNWPIVKFFRPFGLQGDFGYLPALGGHTSHLMFGDQVVEYSLPYLSESVKDIGLQWPLRNLFLFSEFNYSQLIAGPSGQTFPNLVATPGIAYVGYRFELSFGTQFALNNASVPGTHASAIGLLDIFYDSIIPQGNWTLFGG